LDKKGTDKILEPLFIGSAKVEIEIGHRRISGLAHGLDILDNGGTDKRRQSLLRKFVKEFTNQRMLFPDPATMTKHHQRALCHVGSGTGQTFSVDPKQ
jgi:hypothetical protein